MRQLLDDLYQALGVGAALAPDDDDDVAVLRRLDGRLLAVLRRPTDFVVGLRLRVLLAHPLDHGCCVPDAQRGLAGDRDLVVFDVERVDVFRFLHQVNFPRCLADDALRLRVSSAADVDDVVAALGQVFDEVVRDNDIRAGRVDQGQTARRGLVFDRRRDAVRGEDHGSAVDLVQALEPVVTVDQLDPVFLQLVGDVGVVDEVAQHPDLLARMRLRRLLGRADRFDDAVAVAARRDLQHVHRFESTRGSDASSSRSVTSA